MPILYINTLNNLNTQITGSVITSGSFIVTSSTSLNINFTGSVLGTASFTTNSATASFITSSNVIGVVASSSYSTTASSFSKALFADMLQYSEYTQAAKTLGSDIVFEPVIGGWSGLTTGAARVLATGIGYGSMILVTYPYTLTGAYFAMSLGGTYTANNYNGIGLYKLTNSSTYTLVASSSNNGDIWKTGSHVLRSASFSSTYQADTGVYMVIAMYNASSATQAPVLIGHRRVNVAVQSTAWRFLGNNTFFQPTITISGTTLPSTIATTVSGLANVPNFTLY